MYVKKSEDAPNTLKIKIINEPFKISFIYINFLIIIYNIISQKIL